MNKYRFLLISLVAILASSCVKDNLGDTTVVSQDAIAQKKIINTSTDAVAGKLIFYVTEECAERLENAEVTRSGMNEIDLLAMDLGATSIEPVFNLKVNAERKRAMDMHRWYTVSFPTQVSLDDAAKKLAAIDYVETVEFSKCVKRPDERPVVVEPAAAPMTRSSEYQFDDPGLYFQWHYINDGRTSLFPWAVEGEDINAKPAWKLTAGRPEVIVAIVDEGVCYTHEDLKDNMLVNEAELNGEAGVDDDNNGYKDDIYGYNFTQDGRNGKVSWLDEKDTGHGTHVAGTVAAVNNNGKGCAGVAGGTGNGDGVRLLSAQIMSGDVVAGYDDTARAIEYAADRGASVLQCSWGFEPNQPGVANDDQFSTGQVSVEYRAIEYFISTKNCDAVDGGIVIFAAGNEGMAVAGYPGAYRDYICVTAFAPDGLPAYYTCYDKGCNISAPGGEFFLNGSTSYAETGCVYSTLPNNKYGYMQGTSMACPHVSGVAALGLSYALDLGKTFTVDEFKALLLTSVNAFDNSLFNGSKPSPAGGYLQLQGYRDKMGTGKVDAYRLLMAIRGVDCVPISTKKTTYIDFNKFMGNDNLSLKIKDYNIPEETVEALGIEFDQLIGSQFTIQATKAGVGSITIGMIAGGKSEGGGMLTGGMYIEKEFVLIARPDVELDELGAPVQTNGWL